MMNTVFMLTGLMSDVSIKMLKMCWGFFCFFFNIRHVFLSVLKTSTVCLGPAATAVSSLSRPVTSSSRPSGTPGMTPALSVR